MKIQGIKEFPGDFENSPTRLNDIQLEIKNSFDSWHSTGKYRFHATTDVRKKLFVIFSGYYVAAGTPVQINVLQIVGPAGWKARIGCHSDSLNVHFETFLLKSIIKICCFSRIVMNFVDGHAFR